MDYTTISVIVGAVLSILGATWGGYEVAKGRIQKKLGQAGDLLTTVKAALEDNSLSKEEIKSIVEKVTALITFEKEEKNA